MGKSWFSRYEVVMVQLSRTLGMFDANINAPLTSLTVWSSRRPQASLVGALRASHSGAAYRGR